MLRFEEHSLVWQRDNRTLRYNAPLMDSATAMVVPLTTDGQERGVLLIGTSNTDLCNAAVQGRTTPCESEAPGIVLLRPREGNDQLERVFDGEQRGRRLRLVDVNNDGRYELIFELDGAGAAMHTWNGQRYERDPEHDIEGAIAGPDQVHYAINNHAGHVVQLQRALMLGPTHLAEENVSSVLRVGTHDAVLYAVERAHYLAVVLRREGGSTVASVPLPADPATSCTNNVPAFYVRSDPSLRAHAAVLVRVPGEQQTVRTLAFRWNGQQLAALPPLAPLPCNNTPLRWEPEFVGDAVRFRQTQEPFVTAQAALPTSTWVDSQHRTLRR